MLHLQNMNSSLYLTLVLGTETSQLVVAIRGKVQSKPVLAANDGRRKVGASKPVDGEKSPIDFSIISQSYLATSLQQAAAVGSIL